MNMCKHSCFINRIFSCLLILSLALSTVNTANKKIVKAAETEDYIEITNVSELYAIRNNLEGKYILTKDIDLSEATAPGGELDVGNGWVPIDGFRGTLDGNGHYIKGLTMYGEVNQDYVGLFGNAYNSGFTVCNLGLVDVNINITMPKEKTYQSVDWYVGGIVGNGKSGEISSCFVTGNITIQSESSDGCVGGLAGTDVYLKECYNAANVNVYKEDGTTYRDLYVGGLCGISICGSDTMLYNCGTINGGSGGAIAGGNGTGGHDDSGNNFYLQGTGMGESATPHTETQMKNKNYFSKWDFTDAWEIDACSNYSYPQLRTCMQKRVKKMEIVNMPSKLEYEQGDEIEFSDGTVKLEYEDGYDVTIYITEDMIKNTYDTFLLGKQQICIYKGLANTAIEITVNEIPVKEIKLNAKSITLKKGYSTQINATVLPERATYQEVSWSSADETIASVDQTGKVTGKGKGTTTITATAKNGVSVSCRVEVTIPCVSLRVESEDIEIEKGGSYVPNYTLSPLDCTDHVSWKSEDEDVLHIDNDGNWLGIQGGKTAVIGTADSGVTAICNVTVLQDLSEFSVLNIEDKTYTGNLITQDIKVTDGTKTLVENTDYKVRYNANVKVGEASITITGVKPYQGEITRKFNIVPPEEEPTTPVHDLKLDKEKIQIKKGYKEKLSATVLPAEATDKTISWSSQDETVATVDAAGNVTGKGSGTTTITASSKEGVSATCQVTVTVPSLTISLDSYDVTIGKGDAYSPNYKMSPLDSTDTVMWESSDESIVHIDDEGNWIGISGGTVTVNGRTESGQKVSCKVTVRIPCVHIQLDSSELTLNKGESYKPVFQTTPVDTTDHITWSSSDEKVLHIDSEGNWIGKSGGTATVLAKTEDGIEAECKVTVLQNIAEFDVLCVEDKEYTGDVILQDVKVTDGNKTLVKDTDYMVTYSSNIHVGEALITITGKRPYIGSVEKKFFIKSNNKETESKEPTETNKPNETNKVEVSLETNKDAAVNPTNPEKTQTNKVKLSKGQIASIKASKKKLTICWKKVENAVGYQLQVAKDKKFTKGKKNYYLNSATLKKVFKGARKTNYYVRVRAYAYDTEGQTFNGSYSSTKKKKTK